MPTCRCGHPRANHQHYRPGTDCCTPDRLCRCRRYLARQLTQRIADAVWGAGLLVQAWWRR